MANSLIVPPYRAALLTNADGSPVVREDSSNGPIATERQWYMFWRQMGEQLNTGAQQLEGLEGLVTYGNHADRPNGEFQHDGALYVEQDRGSVLYQNQGGVWEYIAGIMYGTLSPDQRPTDLSPSADVGFQFRTTTDPARAFAWNGGQWVETTPIRYGTHAQRLAETIANLVSGMLWMETDRGSVIYQNQGGVWLFLTGTMWGTLVPDQRPTDLGVRDAGFDFRTTVAPPREFVWNQVAWVETTPVLYGTHAARPAASAMPAGCLYIETDRDNVVYQVQTVAGSPAWVYVTGTMTDLFSALPAGLGANDVNFTFATSDTLEVYRWSGSVWVNQTPANDLQFAAGTADLTLTTTATDIPGATITLNRAGQYLITGIFAFQTLADLGSQLRGKLVADGVTQPRNAYLIGAGNGDGVSASMQWTYTAAAPGKVVKLQGDKVAGTGTSAIYGSVTIISALWIKP